MLNIALLGDVIAKFTDDIIEIKQKQDRERERLLREWEETKSMPRKLKKRRRKEILVDWAIVSYYDTLSGMTVEELTDFINVLRQIVSDPLI
jgi:DNA replication initiation complex subunit (GINS family)